MGFFKSKAEREIQAQMERDEQMQVFADQINEIKKKREEYATIAAEAEDNGDTATYDVAISALIQLNDVISGLMQAKANFDIINVSNAIAINLATAVNALDRMADGKSQMPDIRKIQRANVKIAKYMRGLQISQKAMSNTLRTSNPANRARSQAEIDAVRPMVDAARAKITGVSLPSTGDIDISAEIKAERNRII